MRGAVQGPTGHHVHFLGQQGTGRGLLQGGQFGKLEVFIPIHVKVFKESPHFIAHEFGILGIDVTIKEGSQRDFLVAVVVGGSHGSSRVVVKDGILCHHRRMEMEMELILIDG